MIDCENCAHCVDFTTPNDKDSANLKKARIKIEEFVA